MACSAANASPAGGVGGGSGAGTGTPGQGGARPSFLPILCHEALHPWPACLQTGTHAFERMICGVHVLGLMIHTSSCFTVSFTLKHVVTAILCQMPNPTTYSPSWCVGDGGGGSGGGGGTVGSATTSTYIGGTGSTFSATQVSQYGGVSLMKALQLHTVHYSCCQMCCTVLNASTASHACPSVGWWIRWRRRGRQWCWLQCWYVYSLY